MHVKTPEHSDREEGEEGEDKKAETTPIEVQNVDVDDQSKVINVGQGVQMQKDKKGKIRFAFNQELK